PLVHVCVGLLEPHAIDQRVRRDDRVGDGVARLDEHRAAATDAPHHLDAVAFGGLGIDLISQRLEPADHHRRTRPFPDAQGGRAVAATDLVHQHVVQCHVQGGGLRRRVDQLPVVVAPVAATHAPASGSHASSARRTATATPSGVMPYKVDPGASASRTTVASRPSVASAGSPSSAALMVASTESGCRKKSPLTWTLANRPASMSRSTTTSLPPGTLYSPCMRASVFGPDATRYPG